VTRLLDGQDPAAVQMAASLIRAGSLVAFPTETVYGLGADGLDPDAVRRVFAAKGRPADNPVILHVPTLDEAIPLWDATDDELARARLCADAFWPGPLTLVLPAADVVPDVVTAGLGSVAVRAPDNPVAYALLAAVGRPVAAPSANASGRPSPTRAEHVVRTLAREIDAVLDGGETRVGLESTVLDLRGDRPRVLRPGAVTLAQLRAVLGEVDGPHAQDDDAPSPGLRHRHYAPAVDDVAFTGDLDDAWLSGAALLLRAATAAALEAKHGPRDAATARLPDDAAGFGRELYAALYRLEEAKPARLLLEPAPDGDEWRAVRDRLKRAAAS
jgi:L-threonylcarbamoyladenylate synthase